MVQSKSWKTTVLGVLTILGVIIHAATQFLSGQPVDFPSTVAGVTAGVGLVVAADHSVVTQ